MKKLIHKRESKSLGWDAPFGLGYISYNYCDATISKSQKYSFNWDFVTCKMCLVKSGRYKWNPNKKHKEFSLTLKGMDFQEIIRCMRNKKATKYLFASTYHEVAAWTQELDAYLEEEFPEEFEKFTTKKNRKRT